MIHIGSKVAYVADGQVGEPGTPIGIVINGRVMVTMPDYTYPGPPPPNYKPGDDDATDLAWLVFWDGLAEVDAIWVRDTYLIEVPYNTRYKPLVAGKKHNPTANIQTQDTNPYVRCRDALTEVMEDLMDKFPNPDEQDAGRIVSDLNVAYMWVNSIAKKAGDS